MKKIKLLFVEDDTSFAFVVKGSLELTGEYEIYAASNGKEGLELFNTTSPDIIVSDIEMGEMDGMEMVKLIRDANSDIPILFATGRTSPQDVLKGYELNVDNFIKKPYLPDELNAHIKAILKRVQKQSSQSISEIRIGEYSFDINTHLLTKENSRKLTQREAAILLLLHERKGEVVKRDEILEKFWGRNDFFTSRSLDVFINSLRKYLSEDHTIEIQTVRGEGLKLIS